MGQANEVRQRVSPCIEWLFAESEHFAQRIASARDSGLRQVEFWYWRRRGFEELKSAVNAPGMGVTAVVVDPQAPIADRSVHSTWLSNVADSARVARALGSPILVVTAGNRNTIGTVPEQMESVYEALVAAAEIAANNGVRLALEPLNDRVDHPGTLLTGSLAAAELVDKVGSDSLGILLDIYHSYVMGEDLPDVIDQLGRRIAHVQVADHPGRHEPGTGSIPWPEVMRALGSAGYSGPIGLEYKPTMPSQESIAFTIERLAA